MEGALITLAAVVIIAAAVEKWRSGLELQQLGRGTLIVLAAALLNLGLGVYLIVVGRKTRSIILEANGKHAHRQLDQLRGRRRARASCWSRAGSRSTRSWRSWWPCNILWSGAHRTYRSVGGLRIIVATTGPVSSLSLRQIESLGTVPSEFVWFACASTP